MIYVIAENIIFNPHDHSIENGKDDEFVKLSLPASRLLEKLLLSGGDLVTRDYLLTEVWDKNGLRGSNNNLNQYISILRKTLMAYGCDNIIVTIPKIGFRLNTDVNLELRGELLSQNRILNEIKKEKKTKSKLIKLIISLICIVIPIAFFFMVKKDYGKYDIAGSDVEKMPSGCNLIYIHKLGEKEKIRARKQITSTLNNLKLECTDKNTLLFDNVDSIPTYHNYGKTFISYCNIIKNDEFGNCIDYYYSNWTEK